MILLLHGQREVTWHFQKSLSPLPLYLWLINLTGCWLQASAHRHLICHRFLVFLSSAIKTNQTFDVSFMIINCPIIKMESITTNRFLNGALYLNQTKAECCMMHIRFNWNSLRVIFSIKMTRSSSWSYQHSQIQSFSKWLSSMFGGVLKS